MNRAGTFLAGTCLALGSVPVALFTNGVASALQKFAECGSYQQMCHNLPGGAATPIACILGACGLAAVANALNTRKQAKRAAEELAAMADSITTIEEAVLAVQRVMSTAGFDVLDESELRSLAAAIKSKNISEVPDGISQRMLIALEAAGLATAEQLKYVEGLVKENWHRGLVIWEELHAHDEWFRKWSARIDAALGRIESSLTVVAEDTAVLRDAYERGRISFATGPRDNLATAGVPRNDAFVGRVKALNDLAVLINDPAGPHAVAIVAGAGFGKTELAREFVHARAIPGPGAGEWAGRWWLDGSTGGEMSSLRQHFESITGKEMPREPIPAPGEDARAVVKAWRTSLRREIAAACSDGRQLLILDNAETPEQIAHYKPSGSARLIATTRRQPIARDIAREFPLDVMSPEDARLMLIGAREDLSAPAHRTTLDAIAEHVGHHALALAHSAAALARRPFRTPQEIFQDLQKADIGDEDHLFEGIDPKELTGISKRGLAASLALLLDELADANSNDHDPLALRLAEFIAFCDPREIPIDLLASAAGEERTAVVSSLNRLFERSIITLTTSAGMHRLTQSLVRGRVKRRAAGATTEVLENLLDALIKLFRWPSTIEEEATDHTRMAEQLAALAHAEAALAYVELLYSPLPRTPSSHSANGYQALPLAAARLQSELARRLATIGQLASAARHIDAAIEWGERQNPRDERGLAIWYASRAIIRRLRGDLQGAEEDIQKSIEWGERQTPRDERGLAILYASRARIRQYRGDLQGAEEDIQKSLEWGEKQDTRDERGLAIWYASRARILRDLKKFVDARRDIDAALAWYEKNLPGDERSIGIIRAIKASIEAAAGGP